MPQAIKLLDDSRISTAMRARQTYIADSLAWVGFVRNRDLQARFGITSQQANTDLGRFETDNPGAIRCDKRKGLWLRQGGFPESLRHDIATVFRRRPDLRETLGFTSVASVGTAWSPAKASLIHALIEARQGSACVEVLYQSMTSPEETWRSVCPHAFFEDWVVGYVRVFDHKRGMHIDLRIDRMRQVRPSALPWVGPESDDDWNSMADVRIEAHQDLTPQQQASCLDEVGLGTFGGNISTRRSHLLYTLRHLGLLEAVQDGHGRPDKSKMYVCTNPRELQPYVPQRQTRAAAA